MSTHILLSDLQFKCPTCKGSGTVEDSSCNSCEGYIHYLTLNGETLIEFLKSRGVNFPMSPQAEENLRDIAESL